MRTTGKVVLKTEKNWICIIECVLFFLSVMILDDACFFWLIFINSEPFFTLHLLHLLIIITHYMFFSGCFTYFLELISWCLIVLKWLLGESFGVMYNRLFSWTHILKVARYSLLHPFFLQLMGLISLFKKIYARCLNTFFEVSWKYCWLAEVYCHLSCCFEGLIRDGDEYIARILLAI